MKRKELRNISSENARARITELEKELLKERAKIAMKTPPSNPGNVRKMRKEVARLLSHLRGK